MTVEAQFELAAKEELASWREQRPDLDLSPIEILGRLDVLGRLTSRFFQQSLEPLSLHPSDYFLLAELRRAGPPYSRAPGQLARVLIRSSGGMTKQLDQLETRKLLRRDRDPSDRRAILVTLTKAGFKLIDKALTSNASNMQALLSELSPSEHQAAVRSLGRLLGVFASDSTQDA